MNVDSYLRGPLYSSISIEALCYNSSITGLVVNKQNLPELFERILNLGKLLNNNYVPVPLETVQGEGSYRDAIIRVTPSVHLGYAPARGFDTIIYLINPNDKFQSKYSIGYSKLPRVVGDSILNNVETLHYEEIIVKIPKLIIDSTDYSSLLLGENELGEINIVISDPQRKYLVDFKKRGELENSGYTDKTVNLTNTTFFHTFENNISSIEYEDYWWEEGKTAPGWVGPSRVCLLRKTRAAGQQQMVNKLLVYNNKTEGDCYNVVYDIKGEEGQTIPAAEGDEYVFHNSLPQFISGEYIMDQRGGLWICPRLVGRNDINFINQYGQFKPLFELDGNKTYPLSGSPKSQPLLDVSKGYLVARESVFKAISEAQHRIRDIVNTIIPLSLLLSDSGILWIRAKIGAWFVFDLPQFGSVIVQNRETAIVVPKDCMYYPVNDKTLLVRSPWELVLYNKPGEYCDEYTMNTIVTRFPHSKLLGRFSIGGESIDEGDIFHSSLTRYRKNILPQGKIEIIGALNGIILYYQKGENNIYINYL